MKNSWTYAFQPSCVVTHRILRKHEQLTISGNMKMKTKTINTMKNIWIYVLLASLPFACTEATHTQRESDAEASIVTVAEEKTTQRKRAKFEPEDGEVLLFVGQDLTALGAVEGYKDGYTDHFKAPAGVTMYTNLRTGDTSYNYTYRGLDGLTSTDDWGAGPSNMQLLMEDEDYRHSALAIGLELVNHEEKVAAGEHDDLMIRLAGWLKSLGERPVFLRIGYEFDGHDWNHYNKEAYIKAYRRIKDICDILGVTNVAYVWQSVGWESSPEEYESWYPGDAYVDWCAFSAFSRFDEATSMLEFARSKKKPVFIAEATPAISTPTVKKDGKTKETILAKPRQGEEAWEKWFLPVFQLIKENGDLIKALSYINYDWQAFPMWKENPTFKGIDSRLHTNTTIAKRWNKETSDSRYLKASPNLFDKLRQKTPNN